jgi:hypothetical protein
MKSIVGSASYMPHYNRALLDEERVKKDTELLDLKGLEKSDLTAIVEAVLKSA